MNVSEAGLRLIAEYEGFSPVPYNDPVGYCTVGYGELLHESACTPEELARTPITEEQGFAYLRVKVQSYDECVANCCPDLNQNQHDALTSLCYNIGVGGFARSAVRAAANAGGDVCAELRKIIHGVNGVVYPGLVRRREAECTLYNTPYQEEHMPTPEYDELKQRDEDIKVVVAGLDTGVKFLIGVVVDLAKQVYGDSDVKTLDLAQRVTALEAADK